MRVMRSRCIARAAVAVVAFVVLVVVVYGPVQGLAPARMHAHGYQDGGSGLRAAIMIGVGLYGARWLSRRIVPIDESPTGPGADLPSSAGDRAP
jgi:hypothetical protein